ncbi:hypothetical protein DBR17_17740 [Sphingomonas sp. HMWF008]|nr:hypothetical protein DBR17_17740 [Sphingomonas sp. HMWF008]
MGTISYTLKHPIVITTFGSPQKTTTITFLDLAPRVQGKHLLATDGALGPMAAKLRLIAALSGISVDEAQELDGDDIDAIDAIYDDAAAKHPLVAGAGPSPDGQTTGAPSSET